MNNVPGLASFQGAQPGTVFPTAFQGTTSGEQMMLSGRLST